MNRLRPGFQLSRNMRVGLLGGSFNPAHEGHAHVADAARKALGLHKVVWLVSPQNPLKTVAETASLTQRMAGARAVANSSANVVTDLETGLGSPYTVHTLVWLKRRFPGVRLVWLMGSDNLVSLHRWRSWRALPRMVEIAVVPRPGSGARARLAPGGRLLVKSPRSRFLQTPFHTASSTALRLRGRGGL